MAFRILIVDDSPAMRAFISRVADLSGIAIEHYFEAGDGAEAMRRLREQRVGAILTDVNMPGREGEQFLRQVQADELRSIPVLVISTDATGHRIPNMQAPGARGYVTKPFSPETLGQELDRVLEVPCG